MFEFSEKHFRDALLRQGKLFIDKRIDASFASWFDTGMLYLQAQNRKEVAIYIDSSGGSTKAGFHIYDSLAQSPLQTVGVVRERAYSIAAVVLQACDTRIMFPHADLRLHRVQNAPSKEEEVVQSIGSEEMDKNIWKFVERAKEAYEYLQKKNEEALLKRCNLSRKDLRDLLKEDRVMRAEEALKLGFIDEIA